MRPVSDKHPALGPHRFHGRRAMSAISRARYRALLRLTADDGAVTYEEPVDEQEALAVLDRHAGAAADVVLVEESGYPDGHTQRYRVSRTLACMPVGPGDWQAGTTAGSECMRGLSSARKALATLAETPAAHHVFIDRTDDGHLVIGRAERVVDTVVGYFFVADNRLDQRRFDPAQPDAARDTAEYLVELLHVVEQANEQQDRQADAQLERVIDGEVRAEHQERRRHCSDELESALHEIARRWGATP